MRRLRALLSIVTLLAMAMLPGPSHALASAAHDAPVALHHGTHHGGHGHGVSTHVAAAQPCEGHRGPAHEPCKTCSIACCAPVIAAIDAPLLADASIERRLRPARPRGDRDRPDAAQPRALRPPTAAA